MDALLAWLVTELQDPAKAATGFLGSTATFIILVVFRAVWGERKRRAEEEAKVRPTVCTVPDRTPDDTAMALTRRIGDLEQMVFDLRSRLSRVDADRADLASDLSRTAAALNASQHREEALKEELMELRDALDSSHTRLPLPPSRVGLKPISVTELDDRDTPPQGRARVRR